MAQSTIILAFRVRPGIRAAAEKAAAQQNRSLASFLEQLLTDHLLQQGLLTEIRGVSVAAP
jgi:predicted HicB family RNase H-like nuclease